MIPELDLHAEERGHLTDAVASARTKIKIASEELEAARDALYRFRLRRQFKEEPPVGTRVRHVDERSSTGVVMVASQDDAERLAGEPPSEWVRVRWDHLGSDPQPANWHYLEPGAGRWRVTSSCPLDPRSSGGSSTS